ncbi:ABC transporter permease subunit [Maritalea sp.]|jgi:oligopeptide transport system permease protein|uniref:ABC transporter permease subunit n=1 Tax=Maritalea sp. TaxID=2003361 RepID=UPI0039E311E7
MLVNREKMAGVVDALSNGKEVEGRSLWQDAWERFQRNKAAVVSVVVLALMVVLSFVGPALAPWTYEEIDWNIIGNAAQSGFPSIASGHFFGTDDLGRDIFARTMQGTQISLLVGLVGTSVAVVLGVLYGATAGYVGGRVDNYMMRFVDLLMSIPYMFILIILFVMFGRSLWLLFMGLGLFSWMDMARIVRGQTLSIKNKEYIEASVAAGVGTFTIIIRHVLPNLMGIVAVYTTLLIPGLILTESFISFLGLGVQEPLTSWGALISDGAKTIQYGTPWQLAFPLGFFIVGLFCFYFIGDGLRDALDPKDR